MFLHAFLPWSMGGVEVYINELSNFVADWWKDEKYKPPSPRKGDLKHPITFWRFVERAGKSAGIFTGLPFQALLQITAPFLPHRQDVKKATPGAGGYEIKQGG